ncbi:MAG: cyclic nucleotide-binding domain-containing protein [Planctomycetaceae bacterium]
MDWAFISEFTTNHVGVQGLPVLVVVGIVLAILKPSEAAVLLRLVTIFAGCVSVAFVAAWRSSSPGLSPNASQLRRWEEYVFLATTFAEGLVIVRLAAIILFRYALPSFKYQPPKIIQDLVQAAIFVVWAGLWMNWHQFGLSGLLTTSAVMTAVLAFSLQDTLGNLLGGIALQAEHSIDVGDWVKIGDVSGQVVEVTWRCTVIETRDWETVIVPNGLLLKREFSVVGRRVGQPLQWRKWLWFNVDYRYSPTQVVETINDAMRHSEIRNVAARPVPHCLFMEFGDSFGRFAVRYWVTDPGADAPTDSEVRQLIYLALKRAGIPLSIPAQAVFQTIESEQRTESKHRRLRAERLQIFRQFDLFQSLSHEQLESCAEHLIYAPFAPGETLTEQGREAHWLYLICNGNVNVVVEQDGITRQVGELGPSSYFGEIALMTNRPRTASVVARTHVEAYRLDREAFRELIASQPAVAEQVAALIAERQKRTAAVLAQSAITLPAKDESTNLLQMIRSFFRLPD